MSHKRALSSELVSFRWMRTNAIFVHSTQANSELSAMCKVFRIQRTRYDSDKKKFSKRMH